MKYTLILSAAAFSLLLPAAAYSQQEQEKDRPQQEERQKAEPENHQQSDRTQQEEKKQQEEKQKQERATNDRRQQTETEKKQAERDHDSKAEHGRIPEDRFRTSFGREHSFRVERRDDRRFQYGGYWFTYSAWPAGWAYSDTVYVDYIDGQYYLINLAHPGVRVLLVIG